jgi:hypothetical protein
VKEERTMKIYDCREFANHLNVSEVWIRELARKGRIVPAKKAGGRWLFFHNSVVLRPPEHWSYPPRKMKLPHSALTVKQIRKQMKYALEHEHYSKVRNIAGDSDSTWRAYLIYARYPRSEKVDLRTAG